MSSSFFANVKTKQPFFFHAKVHTSQFMWVWSQFKYQPRIFRICDKEMQPGVQS